MAEHKHAEVLRAIADGKAVRWKAGFTWHDYNPEEDDCSPLMDDGIEWEVKPEQKPDVVRYVGAKSTYGYQFLSSAQEDCPRDVDGFCKLTFDGETGKLKSVEIIE